MRRGQVRLAQDFAVAVEGSTASFAAVDPALSSLLGLAEHLRSLPLGPSAQFRDGLRTRLLAVATVAPAEIAPAAPFDRLRVWLDHWRVQKGLAAASAGMAGVVLIAGVATATQRSLPGDPFYGIKRSAEGVQVAFARSKVNQGKRYLQLAETRLDEVTALLGESRGLSPLPMDGISTFAMAGGNQGRRIADTLADMNKDTRRGSQLLTTAFEQDDDRSPKPLEVLADFADRQQRGMYRILFRVPETAKPQFDTSLALVSEVHQRATALLTYGICGEKCAPPPKPSSTVAPEPLPQPEPAPSSDELGPKPCECATAEPRPTPSPTMTAEPDPDPAPSPSPSPSPSGGSLPLPVPEPIGSILEDIIDEVLDLLPTPAPLPASTPPAGGVRVPGI